MEKISDLAYLAAVPDGDGRHRGALRRVRDARGDHLVTWWSGPKNAAYQSAFNPGTFDVQGIMPAAYSLFAMALGIAAALIALAFAIINRRDA